jgi:hypothetical protein
MTTRRFLTPAALVAALAAPAYAQESAPAPEAPPPVEQPSVPPPEPPNAEHADPAPASAPPPVTEPVAPPPLVAAPYPPPSPPSESPASAPNADAETERQEPDDGLRGSHQTHFSLQLGVRTSFISDPGFDLFSEDDAFVQVGLSGGRVLVAEGPLSVAALVGWDYGTAESTARGVSTNLEQHRLWLGAEARYHVLRRLYAFARVAPALLSTQATLRDPIALAEREAGGWSFGVDASAGAAFEVFGKTKGDSSNPRGWVTADGGYGWTESDGLSFSTSEDDSAPTRTASLELGDLALRGGFFRVGIAVTF